MRQPRDNWHLCGIEVHLWHGGIKNRIRKRMLAVTSLSVTFFTPSRHFVEHSSSSLLLREWTEVCLEQLRVMSCLNIFKPAFSWNHANIFCWVYFQFSILNIVCTTKDKGPALSNLLSSFHVPGLLRLFRLIKSKLIILSTVLSLLQMVALNWLHWPAQV